MFTNNMNELFINVILFLYNHVDCHTIYNSMKALNIQGYISSVYTITDEGYHSCISPNYYKLITTVSTHITGAMDCFVSSDLKNQMVVLRNMHQEILSEMQPEVAMEGFKRYLMNVSMETRNIFFNRTIDYHPINATYDYWVGNYPWINLFFNEWKYPPRINPYYTGPIYMNVYDENWHLIFKRVSGVSEEIEGDVDGEVEMIRRLYQAYSEPALSGVIEILDRHIRYVLFILETEEEKRMFLEIITKLMNVYVYKSDINFLLVWLRSFAIYYNQFHTEGDPSIMFELYSSVFKLNT